LDEERTLSAGVILRLLPIVLFLVSGLVLVATYSGITFGSSATSVPAAQELPTRTPTYTRTPTARPSATASATATPMRSATPTVLPGGQVFVLTPTLNLVGWVSSGEPQANHLGDANIHSGIYSGTTYYGVFQFDLSAIPPGTPLGFAAIELVGLSSERLGEGGVWQLELLGSELDAKWTSISFIQVQLAKAQPIGLALPSAELAPGRTNVFSFSPEQLNELSRRMAAGRVSFRLRGPTGSDNNLFSWDSGYQQGSLGGKPVLRLGTGPLAATSTPTYVVVTSTPTPLNAATATAAVILGTPTPLPPNWVTPVVVLPRPEPPDLFAAATRSAVMTAQALVNGTATPTPNNWVLAIYVTATPTPANRATALAQSAAATAMAATTGTATPFGFNVLVVTSTPSPTPTATPLFFAETLTPVPSATPTPASLPAVFQSKIAFLSDRSGTVAAYIMDPDGGNVERLTSMWPYQFALTRDTEANGGQVRLGVLGSLLAGTKIVLFDEQGGTLNIYENSAINYDPSFAPDGFHLAFVSTLSGHDEIYTMTRDRSDLRQITTSVWEWNKHPSWSPDGRRIIWWSNRVTGHKQIWSMNADGTNAVNLSNDAYDDWNPVWIK
jgi:hypothetical protein